MSAKFLKTSLKGLAFAFSYSLQPGALQKKKKKMKL